MGKLPVTTFLNKSKKLPVIDVRSPAEYAEGHIPGAVNIPVFDNEERKQIGTTYKQVGQREAILLGLELVGPKMRIFVEKAQKVAPKGEALVHCWRGGMRSESFAWLLNTAGIKAYTLEGGYKAYRKYLLSAFQQFPNLMVLTGETGSGKTNILHALAELGEQVIDLEAIAHHRGSAFGGIGLGSQPTTEQFHNNLYYDWHTLDTTKRIWVEDESFCIGKVKLPHELWDQMAKAPVVRITLPKPVRIKRLVEEYGKYDSNTLRSAILKIQKRLGGLHTQKAIEALENQRLEEASDILLYYYDKSYQRCLTKKDTKIIKEILCTTDDPHVNALKIIKEVNNEILTPHIL